MKKSFRNYIQETNNEIGFFPEPTPNISKPVRNKVHVFKPAAEVIIESNEIEPEIQPIIESIDTESETEQIIESIEINEPEDLQEQEEIQEDVILEEVVNENQMLAETLAEMKNFLVEQQANQNMMGKLMNEMMETIRMQNLLIENKLDQLDEAALNTAQMLKETSQKLQELSVREINIPAPVVNVALSEQKRIVKTVDRDSAGLITQITEEIQQSVSEDK